MIAPKNLQKHFDSLTEQWSPRVIAQVNDQYVKIAKIEGTLAWHAHEDEDELFYIVKGSMVMEFEDHRVPLEEGDVLVIPKGVQHNPVAEKECWVMLVETVTTKHTGEIDTPKTRTIEEQLGEA